MPGKAEDASASGPGSAGARADRGAGHLGGADSPGGAGRGAGHADGAEVARLFEVVRAPRADGAVVLFISHRREVLPKHVAAAVFVLTAGEPSLTTGLHIPVDAGVAAAFLR